MFALKSFVQNIRLWQNDVEGDMPYKELFYVAYRFSLAFLICITNVLKNYKCVTVNDCK